MNSDERFGEGVDPESIIQQYDKEPMFFYESSWRRLLAARALSRGGRTIESLRLIDETTLNNLSEESRSEALELLGDCFTDLAKYESALAAYTRSLDLHPVRDTTYSTVLVKNLFASIRCLDAKSFSSSINIVKKLNINNCIIHCANYEVEFLHTNQRCTWNPYLIGSVAYAPAGMLQILSEAIYQYMQGDLRKSMKLLQFVLQELPHCFPLWYYAAEIYEQLGEWQRAEDDLIQASKCYPNSWRLHYRLGMHSWRCGEYAEAETHLKNALAAYPEAGEAWLLLAGVLRKQGMLQDAIDSYQKAIYFSRLNGVPLSLRDAAFAETGLAGLNLAHGRIIVGSFNALSSFWRLNRFINLCKSRMIKFRRIISTTQV